MTRIADICRIFESKEVGRFVPACDDLVQVARTGLSIDDGALLAIALSKSGRSIDLPPECAPFGDVPSTGGPASLTTLLCPILVCALGVSVPKISASGSVAGAIDALELIPGYRAELSEADFVIALRRCRFAHTIQTKEFCPADRTLIERRRASNSMRNPWLATVSLLSKKLAVPGATAVFDFRIGITGNIADSVEDAMIGAEYFLAVANRLNVRAGICLTDNRTPPCSAFGRLESLEVLCELLKCKVPSLGLDLRHREMCVRIAATAVAVAFGDSNIDSRVMQITKAIESGAAWEAFCRHLESQGSSEDAVAGALELRRRQREVIVNATAEGTWVAPELLQLKDWLKTKQFAMQSKDHLNGQVGFRLLSEPGSTVRIGDELIRVTAPPSARITDDDREFLRGRVTVETAALNEHLFETLLEV